MAKCLDRVSHHVAHTGWIAVLLLASLACAFTTSRATPEPTVVTSTGDLLAFRVPLYNASLEPGEAVPGTQLRYVGRENDAYNVTIDGLAAVKRVGDSFAWNGVVAPGVIGRFSLRISPTFGSTNLVAVGPVEISVLNPIPVELENASSPGEAPFHFTNIPVQYLVSKGSQVPGTSLIYEGETSQGAELSGTTGYPYRALGDSLIWSGRLRGNVTVRYSLRLASLSEESMRLAGLAELWILAGS